MTTWVVTDFWDAALRYRGQFAGFDLAAGIGYLQLTPGSRSRSVRAAADITVSGDPATCRQVSGSFSLVHLDLDTGLFVNFGSGLTYDGLVDDTIRYGGSDIDPDQTFYSGQVGIERPFISLGKSTINGEYFTYAGGASTGASSAPAMRSTRPASATGPCGIRASTWWAPALRRASMPPP